mgnify:CR=1 FL=1
MCLNGVLGAERESSCDAVADPEDGVHGAASRHPDDIESTEFRDLIGHQSGHLRARDIELIVVHAGHHGPPGARHGRTWASDRGAGRSASSPTGAEYVLRGK